MYSKKLHLDECARGLDVFYSLSREDYILEHFTTLSILKEASCKKAAVRLKSTWYEFEIFPMSLYYMFSDKKSQEKKIVSNFHDCLLQLFNQVNRLKVGKSEHLDIEDEEEDEDKQQERLKSDGGSDTAYQDMKGRQFSLYFTNSYLYFTIYRYLFEKNTNKLAQLFQIAAARETMADLMDKSKRQLLDTTVSTYIILWRILNVKDTFQDLQTTLFRYILFKNMSNINEAMIILSFVFRENQVQENIASHFDALANYVAEKQQDKDSDLADQEKAAGYVLKVIKNKQFEHMSEYLPEFKDFIEKSLQTKHNSITDKSAYHPPRVCPMTFYGSFFPNNELCYLPNKFKALEQEYFEEYVEQSLKSWLDQTCSKADQFEESIIEPIGIKSLSDDFYSYTNSSNMIDNDENVESNPFNVNAPRLALKSLHQTRSDAVDFIEIKEFIEYVKLTKNIRIFQARDLAINEQRNIAPDYLIMDKIDVYEGFLQLNNQRCAVFKVDVIYSDHLNRIKTNIDIMNMYSPFVIKYLGLYFPDDLARSNYSIYFVADLWEYNLYEHIKATYDMSVKESPQKLYALLYRILYFVKSAELSSLPLPMLNPFNIYIGKNEYPHFLIPFFTASYYCHKPYHTSIYKDGKSMAQAIHYFGYPAFENMPDPAALILTIKVGGNKIANLRLNDDEKTAQDLCHLHTFTRLAMYILTGQVPLLQTKPTTVANLLTLMRNDVKSIPTLQKQMAATRKKTSDLYKKTLDMICQLVTKPDTNGLNMLFDQVSPVIPPQIQVRPTVDYTRDILNASMFIEEVDEANKGMLNSNMRRIVLLPSKLVFNGFVHQNMIESARFYHANNLILSLSVDETRHSEYTADFFVDESRTLMLKTCDGNLELCTYMVRSASDTGNADIVSGEKTINIDGYFEGSWVASDTLWTSVISPYITSDIKNCSVY